jgi:ankyrin repeat protein
MLTVVVEIADCLVGHGIVFNRPQHSLITRAFRHDKLFSRLLECPEFAEQCGSVGCGGEGERESVLLEYLNDPTMWPSKHQPALPVVYEVSLEAAMKHGMDINATDASKRTALHTICDFIAVNREQHGHRAAPAIPAAVLTSIEVLLQHGANPFLQDSRGRTAVDAFFALYEGSKNAFDPKMESVEFIQSGVWKKFAVPAVDVRRSRRIIDLLFRNAQGQP